MNTEVAIAELSFEQALKELEQVVGKLEQGDVPLDQSISLYERGAALKKHCEDRLKAAEARVEQIRLSENGTPQGTQPFDAG